MTRISTSPFLCEEHLVQLDNKNRLYLPASVRIENMGDLILTQDTKLPRLLCFYMKDERIDDGTRSLVASFARAAAVKDRFVIRPAELAHLGFKTEGRNLELAIVGRDRYLEIWKPDNWESHKAAFEERAIQRLYKALNIDD